MFVSGPTNDPRSIPNNPLKREEGILFPVSDGLGVRRRIGEMGRAMAVPAARPHGDRGPLGRPPAASASARAAIAGFGFSRLEASRSMAESGRGPREFGGDRR